MSSSPNLPTTSLLDRKIPTHPIGVTLLFLILIGVSWASSVYKAWFAPSCTELINTRNMLISELAEQSPDSITEWASEKYNLSEALTLSVSEQEKTYTTWQAERKLFTVHFQEGKFQKVYISWFSPNLSAKKVLECFGAPSHYTAFTIEQESSWQFAYNFWYPQSGVIAQYGATMNSNDPRPTEIELDSSVQLVFTVPTTIEDMGNLFDFKSLEAQGTSQESLFVAWPGSVERIKIIQLAENE